MVARTDVRYIYSSFDRKEFLFDQNRFHETRNLAGLSDHRVAVDSCRQALRNYDPDLDIENAAPILSRPDKEFLALNSDLGPVTDLQPWASAGLLQGK